MRFIGKWSPGRMLGMILVLVLAVSVLVGSVPGPVLAYGEQSGEHDDVSVAGRQAIPPGLAKKLQGWRFDDEDEVTWGHEYMAKMRAKDLIKGVGDNRFAPTANLTYAEAVTMAVRLMGLEEQAQQRTAAQLRFANAAQVLKLAPWAVGYLDLAMENRLLDRLVDARGHFQSHKPATRLDVVVLLVKAMGLEEEALATAGALDFRDAHLIPLDLAGYVAVARKYGIVFGDDKGKFQPNKPVTRLEMAAMLDRADLLLPPRTPYQVEGKLVAVSEADSTITLDVYHRWWPWPPRWQIRPNPLQSEGLEEVEDLDVELEAESSGEGVPPVRGVIVRRQEYEVSPDALILLDGKPADLGDLPAGVWTRLVLNTDKVAVVVDARGAHRVPPPPPEVAEIEGKVTALDAAQRSITVRTDNGQITVRLAEQVRVRYRGEDVRLSDVRIGDRVHLRLENRLVVRITIQEREQEELEEFEGTVTAITTGSDGTVTLTICNEDDDTLTAQVAANAVVTYEGEPLPLEELEVGDQVEVNLQDGVIVRIKVEERPEAVFTARVESLTYAENRWTIDLKDAAGNTFTYRLSARVQVRYQGQLVGVNSLRAGDQVEVRVAGGLVYRIEIVAR